MGSDATKPNNKLAAVLTKFPPELRPAVLTAIRVFVLGWSVTTAPATLSILITALIKAVKKPSSLPHVASKAFLRDLPSQLQRSVLQNGLPYLLAGAFAGHRFLAYAIKKQQQQQQQRSSSSNEKENEDKNMDPRVNVFLTAALAMIAVRRAFPRTKTLDFTFFALVRALDVVAHRAYSSPVARQYLPDWSLEYGSVIVFTLACTEIMFAWFFAPQRLPR